ncbi:SDR family NAD(P)-dependent oxidoreductase [Pseudokineococcus lusitanus]|uniref:3-oxoacyl-[acyl-carrier protein] reductase n=1 Tax=Pseudokineococcus lusitanus TaxID=763993 RepID=A0A3N1HTB2_9ACTN|nr:SDR family NAD(P)-dependent oxidoreductase [Pseudokineococcus lusitanus]ROP45761.1 3-oxoacyl-[acyl-carrier protein] reductase [Pseudokineococcus lusitanus]
MTHRRVALVTGANHGIGAATARRLAADGCAVLLTFHAFDDPEAEEGSRRAHASDADDVVAAVRADGGTALAVAADLADASVVPALFDRAEAELGPVDVLVHNATASLLDTFRPQEHDWAGRPQHGLTAETVDRQFAVDARAGALLIAEHALRLQRRGATWGRVVTLTSGGVEGFPGEVSYGAAKAALVSYTLSAALELSRFGVTANAVHPPVTDTGWVTDEVRAAVAADDRWMGVAEPDEPARLIAWLASEAADRVTGNVIRMA